MTYVTRLPGLRETREMLDIAIARQERLPRGVAARWPR